MTPDRLSTTFAALADPTRRAILARLASGETTVTELAEPFDMSLPAVTKHLKVLERAGLIRRGREAQWRPCRLEARPLAEASGTKEAIASVVAVLLGLGGIAVAWWIYSARRAPAPAPSRALEKKLWFDELYDGLFYWPAVGLSRAMYALVEGPVIGGSMTGLTGAARWAALRTRWLQTRFVRMYGLAIAAGLGVLVLVFLAVK